MIRRALAIAAAALVSTAQPGAIELLLTNADLGRAIALARWPRTDADRAQFHRRYLFDLDDPPVDYWAATQIEVITPFRRVELMAEEHARANDLWGRGGVRDVEEAIRPWRDRVSVVVQLRLRADKPYIGGVPPIDAAVDGAASAIDVRRDVLYANCGGDTTHCPVVGGTVDFVFDAAAIGQATRLVRIVWNGKELARATIDFARVD